MMSHPGRFTGAGRGVFGLSSWEPLRSLNRGSSLAASVGNSRQSPEGSTVMKANRSELTAKQQQQQSNGDVGNNATHGKESEGARQGDQMLAKYNYAANAASPLGVELSVSQKEALTFIAPHPSNGHWWLARTSEGQDGYVPASYMMVLASKPSSLPWLQGRTADQEEEQADGNVKGTMKPYKSSYDHSATLGTKTQEEAPKYYCEVCEKNFNGPSPYRAHMASKAHKEELEHQQAS